MFKIESGIVPPARRRRSKESNEIQPHELAELEAMVLKLRMAGYTVVSPRSHDLPIPSPGQVWSAPGVTARTVTEIKNASYMGGYSVWYEIENKGQFFASGWDFLHWAKRTGARPVSE